MSTAPILYREHDFMKREHNLQRDCISQPLARN